MLSKKSNVLNSMLVAISLFSYATISAADNMESSNFDIRLYNNSSANKPLYYSVMSEGQPTFGGALPYGDDQGKLVKIGNKLKDKAEAEIKVTDSKGHTIWNSKVAFWRSSQAFYTNTVSLDSHYSVGTNAYPAIHAIGFDIRSQS